MTASSLIDAPNAAGARSTAIRRQSSFAAFMLTWPGLLFLGILFAFPLARLFMLSFEGDGLVWYSKALTSDGLYTTVLRRTFEIAGMVTLACLVALSMVIGLVAGLGRAIRVRRRELAVIRSLGCRTSQIYVTLCWQALTIVLIGLIVGVPLGAIAGSSLWRTFASGLGIMPTPTFPLTGIALVIGVAIVVSVFAALPPGRRAAADRPAVALRES